MTFKRLTPDNWDQHDQTSRHIVLVDGAGNQRTPMGSKWAEMILAPKLTPSVPDEVAKMFEVARGIVVYGRFYYPLYTAGCEQIYHVKEAAVASRCNQLGTPKQLGTFAKRIDWLFENGHLTEPRAKQWTAARSLRNNAAHKKKQSIYDPTMAIRNIETAVELINELFAPANSGTLPDCSFKS